MAEYSSRAGRRGWQNTIELESESESKKYKLKVKDWLNIALEQGGDDDKTQKYKN